MKLGRLKCDPVTRVSTLFRKLDEFVCNCIVFVFHNNNKFSRQQSISCDQGKYAVFGLDSIFTNDDIYQQLTTLLERRMTRLRLEIRENNGLTLRFGTPLPSPWTQHHQPNVQAFWLKGRTWRERISLNIKYSSRVEERRQLIFVYNSFWKHQKIAILRPNR